MRPSPGPAPLTPAPLLRCGREGWRLWAQGSRLDLSSPLPSPLPQAGLAYKLSPEAWFTGKVTHAGLVGLSYAHQVGDGRGGVAQAPPAPLSPLPPPSQISPLTKLTFAAEVDAAAPTADVKKFGITLNITA